MVVPVLERRDPEIQAGRNVRDGRGPPRARDLRRVRGRLAREEGPRRFRGSVQQHAEVRRLVDSEEAGLEQLAPDSWRCGPRGGQAEAAARPGYRDPRKSPLDSVSLAPWPDRRVSAARLSARSGEGKASLRREQRREPETRRVSDLRYRGREVDLPAC